MKDVEEAIGTMPNSEESLEIRLLPTLLLKIRGFIAKVIHIFYFAPIVLSGPNFMGIVLVLGRRKCAGSKLRLRT